MHRFRTHFSFSLQRPVPSMFLFREYEGLPISWFARLQSENYMVLCMVWAQYSS
jgi:hypothetical protein